MKQVESKYHQFPFALELTDLPTDRRLIRYADIFEWLGALDLIYNVDYILFEVTTTDTPNKIHSAYAFKRLDLALQFKLKFCSY